MKISLLLETLSIPRRQRRHFVNEFGGMADTVTCYHVTEAENVRSIRKDGLKAKECQQGRVTRQAACYFFVDENDIDKEITDQLGISEPIIIKCRLTADQILDKANYDGMFNMAFDAWSAIQYTDNVSPDVIS
jgi:hypothetical protein